MSTRVEYDETVAHLLLRSGEVVAWTRAKAEEAVPIAKGLARRRSGAMADSVHAVGPVPIEEGVGAQLRADDFKAGWWEKGTSRNAASPFLRPAVHSVLPFVRFVEGPAPA